jgi:outer membrane protein
MRSSLFAAAAICSFAVLMTTAAQPALADAGDWVVRSRLIFIEPDDSADGTLGDPSIDTGVESDVTVEVDGTYFVTDRFAIEGILATAAQEVTLFGGDVSLGSVYHAPATFLAQYHFLPDGKTRPYVGAGINYTIFYDESGELAGNGDAGLLASSYDLDSGSFGLAGQVGVDFMVGQNTSINLDLKYIQIETDVTADGADIGTVEVNPWIFGIGFGYHF